MSMTDPIADMLTRLRNALMASHTEVEIPMSRVKSQIAGILRSQGFIKSYEVVAGEGDKKNLRIGFLPRNGEHGVLNGIKRVSKPGLRVYVNHESIPKVLNGMGIAILSTSKGIVTDEEARKLGVGGEVICEIW
jgi:small subunit ribosomal protein S8